MIALNDEIKDDVNNALMSGHPVVICGVTADSEPTVSFRGSAQVFGKTALAFWARKVEGSTLLAAIEVNPTVAAIYTNMQERRFYMFTGKARLVTDATDRDTIYDNSPQVERDRDPDRLGVAVIVDLTLVQGRGADGPVQMEA